MSDKAILVDKKVVPVESLEEWAKWFEESCKPLNSSRVVKKTDIDGVHISTIFLALNYCFGEGEPLWFETMIFGGPLDQEQWRYSTYEEAETNHDKIVANYAQMCAIKLSEKKSEETPTTEPVTYDWGK